MSFEQHSMSDFKSVARKRVIQIFEPKNALTWVACPAKMSNKEKKILFETSCCKLSRLGLVGQK